jgi:dolichyl-phosphate beta-glucosyltransferase
MQSNPLVSIIIPTFNRKHFIGDAVESCLSQTHENCEIIVVDDGSTDATVDIALSHAVSDRPVDVITLPGQRGKGAAVRAGMLAADADVIGFVDADLSTPLDELPRVLEAFDRGYDVVIGSRAMPRSRTLRAQSAGRRIGARMFRAIMPAIAGLHEFPDSQCGFKFCRREAARDLFGGTVIERWVFDVEVLRLAVHRGYRVAQIPVAWRDHPGSRLRPSLVAFGVLRDLVRIRLRFALGRYGATGRAA